jgi:hypothetical protein
MNPIPRGIDVLVKKASIDPEFKAALLAKRADAAKDIGLELSDAERMLLASAPREHLDAIIRSTTVSPAHRAVFLGKAAALMLAALGTITYLDGCGGDSGCKGISPGKPADKNSGQKTTQAPSAGPAQTQAVSDPNVEQIKGLRSDRIPPKSDQAP